MGSGKLHSFLIYARTHQPDAVNFKILSFKVIFSSTDELLIYTAPVFPDF